ncbi:ankyrin repeat domain-containing protein [Flavobacterium pectinovorum]|nr:ankyrin repeat domain-containing protein [Flavobacterium pectinovorum]
MKKLFGYLVIFLFIGCNNREAIVDKKKLIGYDYRLFQNTSAWELAKAVEDGNTIKIKEEMLKNKIKVDFREPVFGNTLLILSVGNSNFESVKVLLELGANPNLEDFYKGSCATIAAAHNNDPKYLALLLKYKGNPNAIETAPFKKGDQARETALLAAINFLDPNSFKKVKLLVEAGADINYSNEGPEIYTKLPLADAITARKMDIVLYLLEKGADYKKVIYTRVDNEQIFILEALRQCLFDLHSEEYRNKLKVKTFLKSKGLDYNKEPIPDYIQENIKKKYPKDWQDYIKKY